MSIDYARSQLAKTGDSATLRRLFAFSQVNERYGDVTTTIDQRAVRTAILVLPDVHL